ncbi:OSMotic avoidance abnormal family member-like protein, partial [Dinothrombium tinctorium]
MIEPSFQITISSDPNYMQNDVYKLANYSGGGLLIDCYRKRGEKALRKKIIELKQLMYYNGDGISFREELFSSDSMNKAKNERKSGGRGSTRKICWKMQYRGLYGESLLHIMISCNSETHTLIAKKLLRKYPALVFDIFENEEYY